MTRARQSLGLRGEALVCAHLEACGWRIVARRVRLPGGELDIVARDGGTLVVVEVKARTSRRFGSPVEAVTPQKQRRLAHLASAFLARHGLRGDRVRFDVAAVDDPAGGPVVVTLVTDAFRPGW